MSLPPHLKSIPAGRRSLSREEKEDKRRDRIVDAAASVFAKRGYPGTTVDHIVSAAQTGVSSFYHLFDGKEDCFLHAYKKVIADGRAELARAAPTDAPLETWLLAVLRRLLDLIAARPLDARLVLVEAQTVGPVVRTHYYATVEEAAAALKRARADSSATREIDATLDFAVISGLVWFLQQRFTRGEVGEQSELLSGAIEIVAAPFLDQAAVVRLRAES